MAHSESRSRFTPVREILLLCKYGPRGLILLDRDAKQIMVLYENINVC